MINIGVAEIDITPEMGMHLGGDACRLRPAEKILDPLFCRVMIGNTSACREESLFCIVVLDLCVIGNEAASEVRNMVAERLGTASRSVMLHLLQNHSGPGVGGHLFLKPDSPGASPDFWWTYQGDPAYYDLLKPRILEAVDTARSKMIPVEMCVGGVADGRITHNRRFMMRDGWVQTQATDLSQILCVEGPADPEVGVACFRDEKGNMIAAILHHTGHPVSHFGTNWVTASWPGAWASAFKRKFGERCVPFVVNGCCGNVNVRTPLDRDNGKPSDERIAECLMESTMAALKTCEYRSPRETGMVSHTIRLPFSDLQDVIGRDSLQDAHDLIRREPEPRWKDDDHAYVDIEWLFALYLTDMDRRLKGKTYSYEVQAVRIGDLALPGLIGEPFVEGQIRLKMESPAERTFVAHMCNGWAGYIPPREAHQRKHYLFRKEDGRPVRRGANFYLYPDYALDRIVDTALDLIRELFLPG